uniref:Transcription factor 25 (basic helix-loop-helix) n=1 Tax=Pygocentrus nattereri TaxID=42514 RepID=A0AAR2J128_PYGNA
GDRKLNNKKKKKRKKKKASAGDVTSSFHLFYFIYLSFRNLNSENELKRYFGARAVLGDQKPRQRQRQFHRNTWMTTPKDTWPRFSRPGISMSLLESKDGLQFFVFEHSRDYQQVQFKFFDAVESMDPNNIVVLLQLNPYHVDSLLQLSDVCRIQEDQETARDLIERALYSFECAFHPVFSLTSGTSRLDYRRPENRAFYLAVYKHMMFLEKRGCPRTALEYCKLILSLDPDNDPLCMLLLIDFLCLRCREYASLIRLYEEWKVHRNLSQLPNFAFSVALACYHLSQQEETTSDESQRMKVKSDIMLQEALIMFPGVLMPLLDLCTVQPDAAVSSHAFFGPKSQLEGLYVGRCHSLWKEAGVMLWMEGNVREVLKRVDSQDPLVDDCQNKRKQRYQSAPRSIHRHVLLSEIKEATSTLPLEVTTQPVMSYDPLPPLDSIMSYTRPERKYKWGNLSGHRGELFLIGQETLTGEKKEVQQDNNPRHKMWCLNTYFLFLYNEVIIIIIIILSLYKDRLKYIMILDLTPTVRITSTHAVITFPCSVNLCVKQQPRHNLELVWNSGLVIFVNEKFES